MAVELKRPRDEKTVRSMLAYLAWTHLYQHRSGNDYAVACLRFAFANAHFDIKEQNPPIQKFLEENPELVELWVSEAIKAAAEIQNEISGAGLDEIRGQRLAEKLTT
jgi:methionine-rich copper-binding protein CopC